MTQQPSVVSASRGRSWSRRAVGLALAACLVVMPGCLSLGSYFDEGWWTRRQEFETGLLYAGGTALLGGTIGSVALLANENSGDRNDEQQAAIIGAIVGAPVFLAADFLITWLFNLEDSRPEELGP